MTALTMEHTPFWKKFTPLFGAGLVGVVSLAPVIGPTLARQLATMPNAPNMPMPLLAVLSLIQPTVLMAGSVALGVALAPRLRLRSHIVERSSAGTPLLPALRREAPIAAVLGTATASVILAVDVALRPLLGASGQALAQAMPHNTLTVTLAGLLYGGITEELLMRWGLMTLLVWIGWRLTQHSNEVPRPAVMWLALGITALIFGAGHLPATALIVPLTPLIVVRALVLNGMFGVIAGWLYWRRSLEAAMIAHAMGHVVFTIAALIPGLL